MKIEFTGRQTQVPVEVRRLAERKLQKVARVLPGITSAHVILTADKHRQIAEVSLHSRQIDLTAVEQSPNPRLSLGRAIDKLLRQAQRQRGRRRERKRTPLRVGAPPILEAGADGSGRRIVRIRRSLPKPMTLDEAALEIDQRAEGLLVYRDATTERVNVLFLRKDGNLGLIEPEG